MEAMLITYCPSCGSSAGPTDAFCPNCGSRLGYFPGYFPNSPTVTPPKQDHTALIVVLVVVLLVVMLVIPAILYVMVSGFIGPDRTMSPPKAIGVYVTRSADGSSWVMTFTSVPTGTSQNGTTLTLLSESGSTMMPAKTLYQLEGNGVSGVTYVPMTVGTMYTTCAAGDRILVATGSYPSGTQYAVRSGSSILASGTFR